MKILIAPDSFKGSLSSKEIIALVAKEGRHFFPDANIQGLEMADGGEGTVEALLTLLGGERKADWVKGPLGEPVQALWGILPTGEAVIEAASACGLPLVPVHLRNPLHTTSYGLGELIAHVLTCGCTKIYIGLGGTSTIDGGMGALSALGVRFLDVKGDPVPTTGKGLANVHSIDTTALHPGLAKTDITLLLDVTNPLTGTNGAAHIFGPQKGATKEIVEILDRGMVHYALIVKEQLGFSLDAQPGAGAAGGLGGALSAFLGAHMRSGIDTLLDLMQFDRRLEDCDLVITGEGLVDGQSLQGKAVSGILHRAREKHVPVVVLAGGLREEAYALRKSGVCEILPIQCELLPIVDAPMSLEYAMENAPALLQKAAARLFGLLCLGREMGARA